MSNVPWKDFKYSRFLNNHVHSVYCSSKFFSGSKWLQDCLSNRDSSMSSAEKRILCSCRVTGYKA